MKTGINFEQCNIGSAEMHNTRDPKYMAAVNASPNKKYNIFSDRTPLNSSWVNPAYAGKTLPDLLDELRELYRQKVGQAPQEKDRVREITDKKTGMKRTVTTAGWSPIREGVCPIAPSTRIADFQPFFNWLRTRGLTVIRIDLHRDEGHTDELTGKRKYNHHAHLVIDWVDHTTGKSRKLSKIDASEMQTQLALSLGMERGESKVKTGADHLTPDEYRAKAAAEKVKSLQAQALSANEEVKKLQKQISSTATAVIDVKQAADKAMRDCCASLQRVGRDAVEQFDGLVELGAQPTAAEQADRDHLNQLVKRDISREKEPLKLEQNLRELVSRTFLAITRLGRKLQEVAKSIPFWQKSRLAHEAELQARTEAAEQKAANSFANSVEAVKRAENAQKRAESRTKAADEMIQAFGEKIEKARKEGYQAGSDAKQLEWNRWADEKYRPAVEERDQLKQKVEKMKQTKQNWLQDFRAIARKLTSFTNETVAMFEREGLRDAVGHDVWDEAKQQHHAAQATTQQPKPRGQHM